MKVKAVWEFDADVSGISPEDVDIPGLAIALTQRELAHLIRHHEISIYDFEYQIEEN